LVLLRSYKQDFGDVALSYMQKLITAKLFHKRDFGDVALSYMQKLITAKLFHKRDIGDCQ